MLYVSPTMGDSLGIQGFAAAILGGFGSIPGAIVGGLGIGVIGSFAAQSVPGLLRPGHVRGVHRAGHDPADRHLRREDGEPGMSAAAADVARGAGGWLAVLAVVAWLLPYQLNVYSISVADTAILFALLAVGMGLVMGIAGQVNLAQIAFFGVGAYATAILTTHDGYGFWTAAVLAVIGHRADRAGGRDAGAADPVALPGHRHARAGRRVHRLDHQRAGHRRATRASPASRRRRCSASTCPASTSTTTWSWSSWPSGWPSGCSSCAPPLGRRMRAMRDDSLAAGAVGRRDPAAADDRVRARQRLRRRRRGAVRRADPATSRRRRSASPTCSCCSPWSSSAAGGRLAGCVIGAIVLTVVQQELINLAAYAQLGYGLVVVLVVVFAPTGLVGIPARLSGWLRPALARASGHGAGARAVPAAAARRSRAGQGEAAPRGLAPGASGSAA